MSGKFISIEGSVVGPITNNVKIDIGGGKSPLPNDAQIIVRRFQQLLDGYCINRLQLLRLIPKDWGWTLGTVSEPKALLHALNPDKISWLANFFRIREEWLVGCGDTIFYWPHGYKQPEKFVAAITELGWITPELRMTILATSSGKGNGSLGYFTIVFSIPIAEWANGEITIYQHLNFEPSRLDWSHPPCRYNAMAIARWFHCHANPRASIPVVPTSQHDVEAVADGTQFPSPLIPAGVGGYSHFEDRILRDTESPLAIKNPELEEAIKYADSCGLLKIN